MKPSDQVIANGAVPVSVALIVAELPAQIAPLPVTAAVGVVLMAIVVSAEVDVQPFASVTVT